MDRTTSSDTLVTACRWLLAQPGGLGIACTSFLGKTAEHLLAEHLVIPTDDPVDNLRRHVDAHKAVR